jgi:hypothetical protein
MSECPMHKLRDDLPPLTERIARLPIDERGYPVPAFVQWIKKNAAGEVSAAVMGEEGAYPDFRIVDSNHLVRCVKEGLCWVCGEKLGVHRAYVVGPMCVINHNSAEPPSHVDCAEWSAKGCPFLTKPHMKRRSDELSQASIENVAGIMIERNPGVTVVWQVRNHLKLWRDGKGGILFDIGQPEKVTWWKEGRPATEEEAIESVNSGIEILLKACGDSPEDRNEVSRRRDVLVAELRGASGA